MNLSRIHLTLLYSVPVIGFGIYGFLTGFENPLFLPLLLTGWIVVVIFQAILAEVYTSPKHPLLAIFLVILTPALLIVNALIQKQDSSVVFIEMAAVDMIGIILALTFSFIYKAAKDGIKDAPIFAVLFTIGLLFTAGFYLVRLMFVFFEIQNFDWVTMALVGISVLRSALFFGTRMANIINKMNVKNSTEKINPVAEKRENNLVVVILLTIGIWIILIPIIVWTKGLLTPYQ